MFQELAEAAPDIAVDKIDVADSEALFEHYGLRIPVLQRPDGEELGWPFTAPELAQFVLSRPHAHR